jgi:exonuclease III
LCGDLNTPRRELADGTLLTFAHDSNGRLRPERGERWDRAERALVRDLGWTDAFRVIHGYGTRDASWTFSGDRGGWRLDHVLVDGLRVVAAEYAHEWRRAGLSDHSALVVDLAPAQPPAATTS